jgi:large subunit ribosomal protein L29
MSKQKAELTRIRDLGTEELGAAAERAREELFRLRLGQATNQVENPMSIRAKRRELARVLTIARGRALGKEVQAQGSAAAAETKPKKTRKKKEA